MSIANTDNRMVIPIRDKFANESELMNFTSMLGSLPEPIMRVTRFSATPSRSVGEEKWTLLTDVQVETAENYADVVKEAIRASTFKIRD